MNSQSQYKICQLTTVHLPSDIRIFHKQCRTLANAGYDTVLIAQNHIDENAYGISIRALSKIENRWTRIRKLQWQVLRIVMRENPVLCHFHDPELIPLAILLKLMGKKVIYDVHEDYPKSLSTVNRAWLPSSCRKTASMIVSLLEWTGTRIFDGIIAATPAIAKKFPTSKTVTVQNYPILNELPSESKIPYMKRKPMITYIGGISILRGIRELIISLEILPKDFQCKLVLAGKFDSSEILNEVRRMVGWNRVDFVGWLPYKDIAALLGQVKVGVVLFHPVPNHTEAQPNKLFEYMYAGIPIIASDFPLWKEIISDTGCGLLVNPLDPEAIAGAIGWLLKHPVEAEKMGKLGRAAVIDRYNWDRESKKILDFYSKVIK